MKDQTSSGLPANWTLATLEQVTNINPTFDKSSYPDDLEVSFVPMPAVEAKSGVIDVSTTRPFGAVKKGYTAFRKGDVLFAKITPCMENGKMAVVPTLTNGVGFGSTEFHVLRPHAGISSDYIYYFVSSQRFRYDAEHNMTGAVGQRRVPTPYLAEHPVPIPPENTQLRIVAKIEELFSELGKGVESLKAAREQLKVYRQAVLKHAFEGKLTAIWREENKDKLETADQILVRIKKERDTNYKQKLMQWETAAKDWEAKGKTRRKPPKPHPPALYSKLVDEDLAALAELPKGWVWDKLGWMTCGVEYGTAAKSADIGAIPVLRMGNIQNARIDCCDLVFTSDEEEIEQYTLCNGDVLFNRTNSPELVGKTAIYKGEQPALFAGYLIRVNQIESIALGQYVNMFLNSHVARLHGNRVKTDGVNQSNINGKKLQNYPFPYCSVAEQVVIVAALDEKLSCIEKLEADVEQQLVKLDALRQSILEKAFSGQLVAQHPNDEPASVLLERIKAEKAGQVNGAKKNKRKEAA